MMIRFRFLIIILVFLGNVYALMSQESLINREGLSLDTSYIIQFIALKDANHSFDELTYLGTINSEYVPDRNLYRFSLGVFDSKIIADDRLSRLKKLGYKDAFIKMILSQSTVIHEIEPVPITPIVVTQQDIPLTTPQIQVVDSMILTPALTLPSEGLDHYSNVLFYYTGKSFGVLGNMRSQREHELATEYAIDNQIKFKLVSHACWRAKGLTIFLPSDEPVGDELEAILKAKNEWEILEDIPALLSDNVLLFQDPDRVDYDMIDIVLNSKKTSLEYPELSSINIKIYRTYIDDDVECFIVEEENAIWPSQLSHWTAGEVNRVDYGKNGRLFELPINKGGFGERSALLKSLKSQYSGTGSVIITADLGHRSADFSIPNQERIEIDIAGLDHLGYDLLLPYENELMVGVEHLKSVLEAHPDITLISTNIRSKEFSTLFNRYRVIDRGGKKIGIIGMVDPLLQLNLPGYILKTLAFDDFITTAQSAVDELLAMKVDVIVALSNMSQSNNAVLSQKVKGIDALIGDFSQDEGITFEKEVKIINSAKDGIGSPYLVSSLPDYGVAMGTIKITLLQKDTISKFLITSIQEKNYVIDDRANTDYPLLDTLKVSLTIENEDKGDLLFPAFIDLIEQDSTLENFDSVTKNGRMSQELWEKFITRLLTKGAPAEVAMIRKIPTFLPLIGKLHEKEVRSWLWFEDNIVLMDLKGRDIRRIIESNKNESIVYGGINIIPTPGGNFYTIMGRPMSDEVYYRLATTNVISNGALSEYFRFGLRKADKFNVEIEDHLKYDKGGQSLALRDYILSELKRIRTMGKGKEHHQRIAELIKKDVPYEKLFSFNFVRPTLWTSFNRSYKGEGYDAVPESRIISGNSFVIGAEGGVVTNLDTEKATWDLGLRFAFAEQSADVGNGEYQKTENADDINLNLTYKFRGKNRNALHPYTRVEYDSEFTSTINGSTGLPNPKQKILRNIIGLSKTGGFKWPILEIGATAENDFGRSNYQYGIQGRSLGRFPLDKSWNVIYSLTNNFNYYLPNKNDSDRDLAFKYNQIHELLIPLFGDISLSLTADIFAFQGKTELNRDPGISTLMKVGLSYNRLWKPRFQSLF